MFHKVWRLFLILLLAFGSFAVQAPRSARAAGPWYVSTAGDDSSDCLSPTTPCATINGAIGKASSGETVHVAEGIYTGIGSEVVLIDRDITLLGGWDSSFSTQDGMSTIDGETARRGVTTYGGVTSTIERFIVQNGNDHFNGGGIRNDGSLTLNNSTVRNSTSGANGGGGGGGGISNVGLMTLNNVNVSSNLGGGIVNWNTLTLNNSTVHNNEANLEGGGISNNNGAMLVLNSSTVSRNRSEGNGGGIFHSFGTVILRNTLLAGNLAAFSGPDCLGPISSDGYNLIGSLADCTFAASTGDLTDVDPLLGHPVGNPAYIPLSASSPAVDAGNPAGCVGSTGALTTDQRGASRVGICDIGAYEYTTPGPSASVVAVGGTPQSTNPLTTFAIPLQAMVLDSIGSPVPAVSVTFTAPGTGASGTFADSGTRTTVAMTDQDGLAAAASFTANAESGAYVVTASVSGVAAPAEFQLFNALWFVSPGGNDANDCLTPSTPCATINGAIGKSSSGQLIKVAAGTYTGSGEEVVLIEKDVSLSGGWDDTFTTQSGLAILDGEGARRVITINHATTTLERFQVQNGYLNVHLGGGGGILNNSGNAILNRMTVVGNTSNGDFGSGGGIHNNGTMILNDSAISDNTAEGFEASGAGIYNQGTMTVNNSTVSDNNAGTHSGGGIFSRFGSMVINNSTISHNFAGTGAGIESSGTLVINSSTISQNTAIATGGILQSGGLITIQNSILAGNTGVWPDCVFSPTSAGYNIIGDGASCNFAPTTGDQVNVDPKLGPLMGNPAYHPLSPDSPAIDAGNPAGCLGGDGVLTTDQRGAARSGVCDIGAYEYTTPGAASSLLVVAGGGQRTAPGFAFPQPMQVAALDSLGSPVSGIDVTFTAPTSGASGTFFDTGTNTTSILTDEHGVATASTFTANSQFGAYTVSASASGIGSVDFSLTNAAWYVSPIGDDSNDCSSSASPCATINGAIGKASSGEVIFVAEGTYAGTGTDVVLVSKDIQLIGGWDAAFTTQNSTSLIDGQGERRGMQVNNFTSAVIDHFTVQNGYSGAAGGIWNSGSLTINFSTISGNTGLGDGGGILNLGILTINNSSITNNTGGSGGGIQNGSGGFAGPATADINNSTISGNSAESRGGGIGNNSTGTLTLNSTTVSGNHDGFFPGSGGVYNGGGNATLQNSIVAGNHKSSGGDSDCTGTILSSGYNLIGSTLDCGFTPTTGDLTDIDPHLGLLIGPSGAPAYHPLLSGSPAIDAGNPAGCTDQDGNVLNTDQRGAARVGVCDIGAYEFTTPGPAAVISVAGGDHQSGATTFAFPKPLQVAAFDIQGSPVSGVTVDFTAPASGPSGTFADTNTNTTSAVTEEEGIATAAVFTANDQPGTYIVTASASGLGSVEFHLEQITRPLNDDLAHAKPIPSLPFNDSLDITNATMEPGESSFCGSTPETQSVWYSFTPAADVVVSAGTFDSSFSDASLTLFQQAGPGFNGLNFLDRACFGGSLIFTAQAGATYVLQAVNISGGGGELHVNLQEVSPPANDNFADAEPISSLPFAGAVDITGATTELNEPQFCNFMDKTVWYTFSPSATTNLRADTEGGISADVNVYRAAEPGITGLQFVGCASVGSHVNFLAEVGQIYYIQASPAFGETGTVQVRLREVVAITGRVVDAVTGAPLPGDVPPHAFVTLLRNCGVDCLEAVGSQNADSEGRFVFDNYFGSPLPTGSYEIEVSANQYQTEQFGPFTFEGVNLDVGDLPMDPLPAIGSIRGRLLDAATGSPVPQTFTPSVELYSCTNGNCSEFVNAQVPDSGGRFRFETDFAGKPLPIGTYQVVARADQYEQAQTDPFEVGEGMHRTIGSLRIVSFPVRFSDIQPCTDIPTSGGECAFRVKIWNGLATKLKGDAWSVVNASLPDSFAGITDFQVKDRPRLNLEKGKSKTFRFRFHVPGNSSASESFICTRLFVGQGSQAYFNTIGFRDLFCFFRTSAGFTIASPEAASAPAQPTTAAATGTDIEPNNSCQAAQDMGALSLPFVLDGNLDSSQSPDIDFFRFSGTPGTSVVVDLEGASTSKGTLGDPFLGFFDSNCNFVAFNDDSGSLNSRLDITIPADGIFILAATLCCDGGFLGGGNGSYQLTVSPVVGSIRGRVTDAPTGTALRGDMEPFAFVRLLRCGDFGCVDVNSQPTDSEGRFLFERDFNGGLLPAGTYQLIATANEHMVVQIEPFAVGEAENYDAGDVALPPFPVLFSDTQPCSIPTRGGVCEFSVRITNGLSTRLSGKAWSMVSGSGIGSFTNFTAFQTDAPRDVKLEPGKSTKLRFQFSVPGTVANGAHICALVYVGEDPNPYFKTLGLEVLFCVVKGEGGFTLMSPQDAQAVLQQMRVDQGGPTQLVTEKKR